MPPSVATRRPFSSGRSGSCPDPAYYGRNNHQNRWAFNGMWSYHYEGGNFCMADGSVRQISYEVNRQPVVGSSSVTLLEALASRDEQEIMGEF